jgi:hypothetical protein
MRQLMLLAALLATSAGCSTNSRMLDPVHSPRIKVTGNRESPAYRWDPYESPTSKRVDALWP